MALGDYYLQIEGIKGETETQGFKEQMQIESFSFGAANSGSSQAGTGAGSGKVSIQDFSFTIANGKASPQLFLACAKGNHIKKAVLTMRKSGGGVGGQDTPYNFQVITFGDLVISSFHTGGSAHGDPIPTESCSFNFTTIEYEYLQQKADGTTGRTNLVTYDVKQVKGGGA